MASDSDDEIDLFLKYVDLAHYKENLRRAGVYSFEDLKIVAKGALKLFLPRPAAKRIVRKRSKFIKNVVKKSKYPPMNEFLAELSLEHIQEDLKEKLGVTRVEHFRDVYIEDLLAIVNKEEAKRIMSAYEKEKSLIARCIANAEEKVKKIAKKVLNWKDPSAINAPSELSSNTRLPQSDSDEATSNVPVPTVTVDKEAEPVGMLSSERHPQTQFENYQLYEPDDDDDESTMPTAPPYSPESDTSESSLSSSPADWYTFTPNELAESVKKVKLQQKFSESSAPPASECSTEELAKNLKPGEDFSDSSVMDYFLSARGEDSFQYFDDLDIKEFDIDQVRINLGYLTDLSDDDICDALRFVHSEQLSSHSFFDCPPPEMKSNELFEWHYLQAARVLALRQIYAIATHLNFEECCEALYNCDWNFADALEITLS
ncbi:hypothetical protein Aperf_G00000050251 [Anoplocephala perfoliata]